MARRNDGSAWTTGDSPYRVLRGGSWFVDPRALRSAFRNFDNPWVQEFVSAASELPGRYPKLRSRKALEPR